MNALRARCIALAVFVLLTVFTAPGSARAGSTLVALAGSGATGTSAEELLNRARGELLADGYRVVVVAPVAEADRLDWLTQEGKTAGVPVIAGFFVNEADGIDICLVDVLSSRMATQRLGRAAGSHEQAPEVLARRSVDALRASLIDFVVESLRRATVSTPVVASEVAAAPTPSAGEGAVARLGVEGGLGILASPAGVGPAAVPLARVRFALNQAFQLRLTGAGFGTQPSVMAPSGSATIEQGIAFVDACLRYTKIHGIRPSATLGVGVYYVAVNGDAVAPLQGTRSTAVAAAITGGVGLALPFGSHFEAIVEGQAIVAVPGIAIRFVDLDAARLGRPSLLGSLTLAGWI